MRVSLAVLALLVGVSPALAGGNFMDVAAGSRAVWVTGDFGVAELDAGTGRMLRTVVLGPLYPSAVGLGGGAVWVAGVENGFEGGTVTRIDAQTGARRTIFRREGWAPQQVAVSGRLVWVLLGRRQGYRLARFDLRGRLVGITRLGRDAGWLTADAGGAWVCCRDRALIRVDPRGRARVAFPLLLDNPIWAAAGSVWLAGFGALERIDERTGRIGARIPLADPRDVTSGPGSVYALGAHTVLRIDPATNRVLARHRIAGVTQAVSATTTGVWVAAVSRPATSRVFELDPRTLALRLTRRLG